MVHVLFMVLKCPIPAATLFYSFKIAENSWIQKRSSWQTERRRRKSVWKRYEDDVGIPMTEMSGEMNSDWTYSRKHNSSSANCLILHTICHKRHSWTNNNTCGCGKKTKVNLRPIYSTSREFQQIILIMRLFSQPHTIIHKLYSCIPLSTTISLAFYRQNHIFTAKKRKYVTELSYFQKAI